MNTAVIRQQLLNMRPSSFSEREQQLYRAEKMLLRQFILMKQQHEVPRFLSTKDMKKWLLKGRSFIQEFQQTADGLETRELLLVELEWSSVRRLCVDQMEREISEEVGVEKRLSERFGRKVTLEGLEMFLLLIYATAGQDVRFRLLHLSHQLLLSSVGSDTGSRFRLALLARLQGMTALLGPELFQTAVNILLLPKTNDRISGNPGEEFDLILKTDVSCMVIGQKLADALASCFCLNTRFSRARLLRTCMAASRGIVSAIYKRFIHRSRSFRLLDFDESASTARESVLDVVQDMMDDHLQRAALSWEQQHEDDELNHEEEAGKKTL